MSVSTGIAPDSLLELDGELFDAIEQAAARAWATRYTLAARTLEVLDVLRFLYVSVHSSKGQRPAPPARVPMPEGDDWLAPTTAAPVLTPSAFLEQYGPAKGARG